MSYSIQLVFDLMSFSANEVFEMLRSNLAEDTANRMRIDIDCGPPHFGIKVGEMEFGYGHIRNHDHSLVSIKSAVVDIADAESWVGPFRSELSFRQAWLYDNEYVHWQNASDLLEYSSEGRSYVGLPLRSNGRPFPLERTIVDTSKNPGRRVIRNGYVEMVGNVMWLGEKFWSLTGADKKKVLSAKWVAVQELPNKVIRLQVADTPFTTAEGESGKLQDKLRKLLYPKYLTDSK